MTGAILLLTRPAMIIRSLWRGEPRKTSAPKRARSKREAPVDIISIAQQAKPKVMGQMEVLRAQLMALSSVVVMTPSSRGPSNRRVDAGEKVLGDIRHPGHIETARKDPAP